MGLDLYLYTQSKLGSQRDELLHRTEVAYFRKFNAFFNWVDVHVNEVENCKDVILNKDTLQTLLNTLKQLDLNNCQEFFPTRSGFYFGTTEYDEWYWQHIKELQNVVHKLLNVNFDKMEVYFYAWW